MAINQNYQNISIKEYSRYILSCMLGRIFHTSLIGLAPDHMQLTKLLLFIAFFNILDFDLFSFKNKSFLIIDIICNEL